MTIRLATLATALAVALPLVSASAVGATTLDIALNVDDAFTAFVSTDDLAQGTAFLASGATWPTTHTGQTTLTAGVTNYLHILAQDNADPAMMLGLFTLDDTDFAFGNGTQRMVTGDAGLQVSTSGWGGYSATLDRGGNGTAPWGFLPHQPADARFVWATDLSADYVYFTAALTYQGPPINPSAVPLPAGLPLLLAGLAALGLARRRTG